jgi:hypothetical protein
MPSFWSSLIEEAEANNPFKKGRVALLGKDGQAFTKSYRGGTLITTDKFKDGDSVIIVTDNEGNTHILGSNYA